jgi:hypothetical protein
MALVRTNVLAYSGRRFVLDGYCDGCHRLLSYGEMQAQTCWWCQPETRPEDFQERIDAARKRAKSKAARGARRSVTESAADEDGGDEP